MVKSRIAALPKGIQGRQGDIMFIPIPASKIPSTAKKVPFNGVYVAALGEATGHCHSISGSPKNIEILETPNTKESDPRFIKISGKEIAEVTHDEHAPIGLAEGAYMIQRAREYDPYVQERVVSD